MKRKFTTVNKMQILPLCIILVLTVLMLNLAWKTPQPAAQPQPNAAASETTSPDGTTRVSPVVGILVLLAPLAYLAWKSRGAKQPKIAAAACLPVIDENKPPSQK
jgi:hypothetical protein